MLQFTAKQAMDSWCVYTLKDSTGKIIFIWSAKLSSALSILEARSNPHLNLEVVMTFEILGIFPTQTDARNAMVEWLRQNFYPSLNRTVRLGHYNPVRCIETLQVWPSQAECARQLGLNQGQLSQHLRRSPGFKTIRGLTFEHTVNPNLAVTHVEYPVPTHPSVFPQPQSGGQQHTYRVATPPAPPTPPVPPVPTPQWYQPVTQVPNPPMPPLSPAITPPPVTTSQSGYSHGGHFESNQPTVGGIPTFIPPHLMP